MERWVGSYERNSRRPLTAEERAQLERRLRRSRVLAWSGWTLGVLCFLAGWLPLFVPDWALLTMFAIPTCVAFPLVGVRGAQAAKLLRADLEAGDVEEYEWEDQRFTALAGSGTVVDESLRAVGRVRIRELAGVPPIPAEAVFPKSIGETEFGLRTVRALTQEEIGELRTAVRQMTTADPGCLTLGVSWLLVGSFLGAIEDLKPAFAILIGAAILYVLYFLWRVIIAQMRFKWRLMRDLRRAEVFQMPAPRGDGNDEILPASKIIWTHSGAPAKWRRFA